MEGAGAHHLYRQKNNELLLEVSRDLYLCHQYNRIIVSHADDFILSSRNVALSVTCLLSQEGRCFLYSKADVEQETMRRSTQDQTPSYFM